MGREGAKKKIKKSQFWSFSPAFFFSLCNHYWANWKKRKHRLGENKQGIPLSSWKGRIKEKKNWKKCRARKFWARSQRLRADAATKLKDLLWESNGRIPLWCFCSPVRVGGGFPSGHGLSQLSTKVPGWEINEIFFALTRTFNHRRCLIKWCCIHLELSALGVALWQAVGVEGK